jgi:hypothetical protein
MQPRLEVAKSGNWFLETNLVIARVDKLSRNEDVQQKLQAPDCRWDLVVCDEAGPCLYGRECFSGVDSHDLAAACGIVRFDILWSSAVEPPPYRSVPGLRPGGHLPSKYRCASRGDVVAHALEEATPLQPKR